MLYSRQKGSFFYFPSASALPPQTPRSPQKRCRADSDIPCTATMLGVYLCVLLPAGMESRQRLVGFMTALVIYIAAMIVYTLIAKHVKKTVTEEKNFRSQSADKANKSKNENE